MADETAKESKINGGKKSADKVQSQWKSTLTDLGFHVLTGFLSGFTLAAGGYAFQSLMRGNPTASSDSNVLSMQRFG